MATGKSWISGAGISNIPPGQLTITKSYDTNTGTPQSPGSAFGGDAALAANFFAAVSEACTNFQNWFCKTTPLTLKMQFGWGTLNNAPFSAGSAGSQFNPLTPVTWSNFYTALNGKSKQSTATAGFATLPSSDPTSGNGITVPWGCAANLNLASGLLLNIWVALNSSFSWFWSQSSPDATKGDAVGDLMHEMAECCGWYGGGGAATSSYALDWYSYSNTNTRAFGQTGYFSTDSGSTGSGDSWGAHTDARDWDGLSYVGSVDCRNGSFTNGLQIFSTLDKNVMDCLGWEWTGA